MKKLTDIEINTVVKVSVDQLVLDEKNPRLLNLIGNAKELDIINQLYRSEDLSELLQSIAANGYMDIEPLIVEKGEQNLIVLEGNRRLAAIRLFLEPELTNRLLKEKQLKINVPEISEKHLNTLSQVSVYVVAKREDARSFIGFKHINGAARWESYAKARFAAEWYGTGQYSLAEIARSIGDRHDTIKKMVSAIYVLEQAEEQDLFHINDRVNPKFNFSHLYTALSRRPYMKFLGLDITWSNYEPQPFPVPSNNLDNLREVLRWIYGSKEDDLSPLVQTQNPDIKNLAEVLDSPEGLVVLRATKSLHEAHASTHPPSTKFSQALFRTRNDIRETSNNLRGFDVNDDSLLGVAEDISETAQAVHERMRKKIMQAILQEKP